MQRKQPNRSSHESISIEINGVKYNRIEDVPAEFRALLQDKNNNGIPDFVESFSTDGGKNVVKIEKRIVKTESFSDEDAVRLLKRTKALGKSDDDGDSLPRFTFNVVAEHGRNIVTTLTLAFIIALALLALFIFYILPQFI